MPSVKNRKTSNKNVNISSYLSNLSSRLDESCYDLNVIINNQQEDIQSIERSIIDECEMLIRGHYLPNKCRRSKKFCIEKQQKENKIDNNNRFKPKTQIRNHTTGLKIDTPPDNYNYVRDNLNLFCGQYAGLSAYWEESSSKQENIRHSEKDKIQRIYSKAQKKRAGSCSIEKQKNVKHKSPHCRREQKSPRNKISNLDREKSKEKTQEKCSKRYQSKTNWIQELSDKVHDHKGENKLNKPSSNSLVNKIRNSHDILLKNMQSSSIELSAVRRDHRDVHVSFHINEAVVKLQSHFRSILSRMRREAKMNGFLTILAQHLRQGRSRKARVWNVWKQFIHKHVSLRGLISKRIAVSKMEKGKMLWHRYFMNKFFLEKERIRIWGGIGEIATRYILYKRLSLSWAKLLQNVANHDKKRSY